MSSKRKSIFKTPLNNASKRIKSDLEVRGASEHASQPPREAGGGSSLQAPDVKDSSDQECSSRLGTLKDLVRVIVTTGDLEQNHVVSDVANAIAQLHMVLQAPGAAAIESSIKELPDRLARPLQTKYPALPALPSILDDRMAKAVFTHPGVSKDIKKTYDRLEILGDAYIELMATKLIWNEFAEISSGRISQVRELLVKNETLSEFATLYGLDSKATIPHDYLNQPKRLTKTKGDIFEAYVAAVILSRPIDGYDVAEQWLTQLWLPKIRNTAVQQPRLDAKETLARKIMGRGIKLKYIEECPPSQDGGGPQTFHIGLYLTGWGWQDRHLGSGHGPSKAIAGDAAARQALLNEPLINEISQMKRETMK